MGEPSLPATIKKFPDIEDEFWPLYECVRPFTMTSPEKLYDLYKSVEYVVKAGIPGSIVECGVWKGGSMMLVAETLKLLDDTERDLLLFDTFEGLPVPDAVLDLDLNGNPAIDRYRPKWAYASLDEVKENMARTDYPYVYYYKGMVEDTVPTWDCRKIHSQANRIALVRLDTDWYSSTKVTLEQFWGPLGDNGFLIVDDYGHWQGARKATDEFFADKPVKMTRVDYSCRVIQKPAAVQNASKKHTPWYNSP